MSRFGGRFVPNIEHEVRRQATEPIVKWRQEWVIPTNTTAEGTTASTSTSTNTVGVKILKWVRVPDTLITFPEEQDVQAADRISDDAAIVEAPVQSIHNVPAAAAVGTPIGGSISSVGGGLGTIAPKDPPSSSATPAPAPVAGGSVGAGVASAMPPHMSHQTTTTTFSEPTTSTSTNTTTGDNTPTDTTSLANTPTQNPLENEPSQIQPQVETQLIDQPTAQSQTDDETLAVLAAGAEAEQQPTAQEETLVSTDPNSNIPATTFEDETPVAAATGANDGVEGADVEMKDA